jgi:hypothetical protein
MADLFGMALGGLLTIACFREIAFAKDNSRLSWTRGGLIGTPFIFVVSTVGRAENGVLYFSESIIQALIAASLTLLFYAWARVRADEPYERKHRKVPRILAWVWIALMSAVTILKLSNGLI